MYFNLPNKPMISSHYRGEFPGGGHECCCDNKPSSLSPAVIMYKPQQIHPLGTSTDTQYWASFYFIFYFQLQEKDNPCLTRKPALAVEAQWHHTRTVTSVSNICSRREDGDVPLFPLLFFSPQHSQYTKIHAPSSHNLGPIYSLLLCWLLAFAVR